MSAERRLQNTGVWWCHPAFALACPAVLVSIAAYTTPAESYSLYWKTGKFFDSTCLLVALGCIAAFTIGALFGQARRSSDPETASADWLHGIPWRPVATVFNVSFVLCVLGYLFWAAVAIKNGINLGLVMDALMGRDGAVYVLREQYLTTVAGVTTLTQFGIATVVLGPALAVVAGWRKVRWQLAIVLFLALMRAILHSERLALIELAVPLIVSWLLLRKPSRNHEGLWRNTIRLAPVAGGGVLFLVFSAFEYSRSWLGFYSTQESSFWRFAALRLLGYYSTALNNGALMWKSLTEPLGAPYFTFAFAWKFPLVNEVVRSVFPALSFSEAGYMDLLDSSANPEFNNPGGLFLPVVDFGIAGALLYWAVCGAVCGYLYKEARKRTAAGIFLYPAVFTSLIEVSRVLYWADGRFFPPMFLLVVSVLFLFREPLNRHVTAAVFSTPIPPRTTESRAAN